MDAMYNGVLLHVQIKYLIHRALKKFPYYANGHGKAECNDCHEYRRELDREFLAAIKNVNQREPDGRHQESIYRMQCRIPESKLNIIRLDFSQYLRRKYEDQYRYLQSSGKFYLQVDLYQAWHD